MLNNSLNSSSSKSNYLLIFIASLFGLFVVVVAYEYMKQKQQPLPAVRPEIATKSETDAKNLDGLKTTDMIYGAEVPLGFKAKSTSLTPQVFNISENIYTYDDAEAVCKVFGAELATYEQLVDAYKKGADWCNYGWTKGQMALYPTQYKTWLKMQENDPDRRNDCGSAGINGGYFDNRNLMFGVNCYGMKPAPRSHEKMKRLVMSDKERRIAEQVANLRNRSNDMTILPFNENKWSDCKI